MNKRKEFLKQARQMALASLERTERLRAEAVEQEAKLYEEYETSFETLPNQNSSTEEIERRY